jgi:hypothetical protein
VKPGDLPKAIFQIKFLVAVSYMTDQEIKNPAAPTLVLLALAIGIASLTTVFPVGKGVMGEGRGLGAVERNTLLDKPGNDGQHALHGRLVAALGERINKSYLSAFKSRKPEITKTRNATRLFFGISCFRLFVIKNEKSPWAGILFLVIRKYLSAS